MKRQTKRLVTLAACAAFLGLVRAGSAHSVPVPPERTPNPSWNQRSDDSPGSLEARDARRRLLERARWEEAIIRSEHTAILLGELLDGRAAKEARP